MIGYSDSDCLLSESKILLPKDIPSLTQWNHICSFCNFDLNFVPLLNSYFINHWKIQYCPVFFVILLMISSVFIYFLKIYPLLGISHVFSIIIIIFFIFFFISYISIILVGPGYLPYFYPMELNLRNNSQIDYLSGIVSNIEQENYVKQQPKLKRAGFFQKAKRIVLRPDHFCGWTGSFIGKKNHKLFFLFNIWGTLYISSFIILDFMALMKITSKNNDTIGLIICFISLILCLSFILMTGGFSFQLPFSITQNRTQFERMYKDNTDYRKGTCIENWEEIFGSSDKWYFWIFPISPFSKFNDYQLYESDL